MCSLGVARATRLALVCESGRQIKIAHHPPQPSRYGNLTSTSFVAIIDGPVAQPSFPTNIWERSGAAKLSDGCSRPVAHRAARDRSCNPVAPGVEEASLVDPIVRVVFPRHDLLGCEPQRNLLLCVLDGVPM